MISGGGWAEIEVCWGAVAGEMVAAEGVSVLSGGGWAEFEVCWGVVGVCWASMVSSLRESMVSPMIISEILFLFSTLFRAPSNSPGSVASL